MSTPAAAENRWTRMKAALDRKNWLPSGATTPEEIGRRVKSERGDVRVLRFVEGYYYPAQYGGEAALTEAQAEELVASLEEGRGTLVEEKALYQGTEGPLCFVCRRRPLRGKGS